jgi:hypothetical protein
MSYRSCIQTQHFSDIIHHHMSVIVCLCDHQAVPLSRSLDEYSKVSARCLDRQAAAGLPALAQAA